MGEKKIFPFYIYFYKKGTEYLDPIMADSNGSLIRKVKYLGNNKMIISNIAQLDGTKNSNINISTRVYLSRTDASFSVKVFIYTDDTLTNP